MQNPYEKKPTADKPRTGKTEVETGESVVDVARPFTTRSNMQEQPRQLTFKRKLSFALLKPAVWLLVNFIWLSCRVKVVGQVNMDKVLADGKPVIPVYWHQQHLFCGWYMLQQLKRGLKVGFLISPSGDGDIPAKIVASRGARVIRGSSTRTGAQALREMYQVIVRQGVSPVTTPDGPTGPRFKFKPGAVMLSRMTGAPLLPIACATKNAWYLGSWDKFMLPKPFTQVVIVVGEPVVVESQLINKDLPQVQMQMEKAINAMIERAKQV